MRNNLGQIGQFYCFVKIGGCARWMQVFSVIRTAISKMCRDSWNFFLIYSDLGQLHQYFAKNVGSTREGRGFSIIWRDTVEVITKSGIKLRQRLSEFFWAKLGRFSYFLSLKMVDAPDQFWISLLFDEISRKLTSFDNLSGSNRTILILC